MPWWAETLTWARDNLLRAVAMGLMVLGLYGAYRMIDVFVPLFATDYSTEHADLRRAVESYAKLDTILTRIRLETKSARAALFRFHDSSTDASKMAFYFVSVANIVGVAPDQDSIKDLPASTFTQVLPTLFKDQFWFSWTKDVPDSPLKELLTKRGDRAVMYAPMKDLDDNPIGMLSVEWLSELDVPNINDKIKADLEANATLISGYFSLRRIKDKDSQ